MSDARAILEAETPKGILRQFTSQPFDEWLSEQGFVLSHHRWWVKTLPTAPCGLYGVFWAEVLSDKGQPNVQWFSIVFHIVRPGGQPYQSWRVNRHSVPQEADDQLKVRQMLIRLIRDLKTLFPRSPARTPTHSGDIDEAGAQKLAIAVNRVVLEFEVAWNELMNQPF